jgi:hypothetical protein
MASSYTIILSTVTIYNRTRGIFCSLAHRSCRVLGVGSKEWLLRPRPSSPYLGISDCRDEWETERRVAHPGSRVNVHQVSGIPFLHGAEGLGMR